MVILGSSVGANPRTIALAHTARLVTILIALPIFINQLPDVGLSSVAVLTTAKAPINLEVMGIFFAVAIFAGHHRTIHPHSIPLLAWTHDPYDGS